MSTAQQNYPSAYRLKFKRNEFLNILSIAKPKRVYRVKNFYYFSFDGFIMYSNDVNETDMMSYPIIEAIEFSNQPWMKTSKF